MYTVTEMTRLDGFLMLLGALCTYVRERENTFGVRTSQRQQVTRVTDVVIVVVVVTAAAIKMLPFHFGGSGGIVEKLNNCCCCC